MIILFILLNFPLTSVYSFLMFELKKYWAKVVFKFPGYTHSLWEPLFSAFTIWLKIILKTWGRWSKYNTGLYEKPCCKCENIFIVYIQWNRSYALFYNVPGTFFNAQTYFAVFLFFLRFLHYYSEFMLAEKTCIRRLRYWVLFVKLLQIFKSYRSWQHSTYCHCSPEIFICFRLIYLHICNNLYFSVV